MQKCMYNEQYEDTIYQDTKTIRGSSSNNLISNEKENEQGYEGDYL